MPPRTPKRDSLRMRSLPCCTHAGPLTSTPVFHRMTDILASPQHRLHRPQRLRHPRPQVRYSSLSAARLVAAALHGLHSHVAHNQIIEPVECIPPFCVPLGLSVSSFVYSIFHWRKHRRQRRLSGPRGRRGPPRPGAFYLPPSLLRDGLAFVVQGPGQWLQVGWPAVPQLAALVFFRRQL